MSAILFHRIQCWTIKQWSAKLSSNVLDRAREALRKKLCDLIVA